MHRAREKFLCLLVLVFAFVSAGRAEVGGKITGVVKDQTGRPLRERRWKSPIRKQGSS